MTATELDPVAVVAQCLDNQWVPRDMLPRMRDGGLSLVDVHDERRGLVRAEYLRALLTCRQLIINRAYLFNNEVIFGDLERDASRRAFLDLIDDRALVPYFYREKSPLEQSPGMHLERGYGLWADVCKDASNLACLRLSWDEDENVELTNRIALNFHEFATGADGRAAGNGIREFARHLGIPADAEMELRSLFRRMRDWANGVRDESDRAVRREEVYNKFISPDGADATLGLCDRSKQFSAELKQLIDLQYNTALPEFLDRPPLRPADTLHRSALREPLPTRTGSGLVSEVEFERTLLSRLAFDKFSDDLTPIDTPYLLDLDLPSVVRVRKTEEWHAYIEQLAKLMAAREASDFRTHGDSLIATYGAMLKRLGDRGVRRHPWRSKRQVIVEVAGVAIRITYGRKPSYVQIGTLRGPSTRTMATVRFAVVNGAAREPASPNEPTLVVDTLRTRVADPAAFVASIVQGLKREKFEPGDPIPLAARRRLGGLEQDLEANPA